MIKVSKTVSTDTYHAVTNNTSLLSKKELYINLSGFEDGLEQAKIYERILKMIQNYEKVKN